MQGKRILLGITGGIAAYKIPILVRLLKKQGAEVRCILSPHAQDFVSPLVLATLSQEAVYSEFWNKQTGVWTNHVELGLWADVMLIAPATANTVSKMASGACDNLLLATYLSLKCPCIIAPAMDLDMYQHPSFKRNLATLAQDRVQVIPATFGALASGLEGQGRMEEPEQIAAYLQTFFQQQVQVMQGSGQKWLITAGPTREPLDPVRYLSNHSTGKMGFALAAAALQAGHEVLLITGPTQQELTHPNLKLIHIETAEELLEQVQANWSWATAGIFSAAVADYRVAEVASEKIKKSAAQMELTLVKNPDVLAWAAAHKNEQIVVGFALETNNSEENALMKLRSKKLDYIVLNEQQNGVSGFGSDTNKMIIFDRAERRLELPLQRKSEAAAALVQILAAPHE
ncbi:MAG: bifunctional phosphopantothenoylcysteine decarboxylase/phosphopantothenate--cysteine ligase CoaBC [Cryomorphaceae bacterium]|nr:bifunctional phosphopantothenoylcysteine decarboxylase/phosphopantothenate--cysteine ligase CoaBC [Cryomorphaceae bacterium]